MSDSNFCGAMGVFDAGSDNYYLIGDYSYDKWCGSHICVLKSKIAISDEDLWIESETSQIYENNGVRAVVKEMDDPNVGKIFRESYLDNEFDNISRMAALGGYVSEYDRENKYNMITDKNGDIVFKRKIQEEY